MNLKKQPLICLIYATAVVFVVSLYGCCSKVVTVGSPYDRYDHNRTQQIEVILQGGNQSVLTRYVVDEVYIPYGSQYFPIVHYEGKDDGPDRLPAGSLVPIFTGILLPLSDEVIAGSKSDRKDLIDFLAKGPWAKNGVEPGDTAGDAKSAEIAFKPVIDLLESRTRLAEPKEKIIESMSSFSIDVADEVIDSRYSLASFKEVMAFGSDKFWFILYKIPDNDYFSRLVVVPAKIKGQDFSGKRP
jgi:hypothetical protein